MREPMVLLGLPLERFAVNHTGRLFGLCATGFVIASYVIGWLIDGGI